VPLNHVALTVTDRERSAEFYRRQFGLTERVHDDEHLLILGDEVRGARRRLRDAGVPEAEWQDDPGMVRLQMFDPDGYRVELFAIGARSEPPASTRPARSRWTSFVADRDDARPRLLCEEGNPAHRLRVEHDDGTLLVHLSDEDGRGTRGDLRRVRRFGRSPGRGRRLVAATRHRHPAAAR
jgi:catechol 2,3-dioxygenase-like lactoylglutathione lyase family enzyme